ncbi:hypothetical protein PG991_013370 [Apiospora marii]|uniref:2EXR domain-containing protein n=1 Tax=Apiospora marii TaxID=335849 RepID=A0ABR1R5V8_9PEZI
MGCPVRFFRAADGHGLQFLPTINDRGGWDAVKILIVEEHQAARFGGDEDHSEHRVFLEFMGRCIWHVFKPEFFSKDDVDADQLIGSHRFIASCSSAELPDIFLSFSLIPEQLPVLKMVGLSDSDWGAPWKALNMMTLNEVAEPAPATESCTFHPFPRLPAELRCQIWQNTWIPGNMDLWASGSPMYRDWNEGRARLLPVSAHVHQESRSETLRKYYIIPNTPEYEFRACVNFELDTLFIDRFTGYASEFPENIFQKFERMKIEMFLMHRFHDWHHPTPTVVPNLWITEAYFPTDRPDHETFDNFVRYVVRRYFTSLQEIEFRLDDSPQVPRLDFMDPDIALSLRPLFIRTSDGQGVEFLPSIKINRWHSTKIRFVGKREADGREDAESAEDHQVFLKYLSLCLWHVFAPDDFLKGDREIEQLVNGPE